MANEDFLQITIKDVELHYPKLDRTYRFNAATGKSEPCAPNAVGAAWSVSFDMKMDEAKQLRDKLVEHYNACRARRPDIPPFARIFGAKKLDAEGVVRFTAKRNGVNAKGEPAKAPEVVNGRKLPLEDKAIWSGSRGNLVITAFPATDPKDKAGGITMSLSTVQVFKARYGTTGLDALDVMEDEESVSVEIGQPAAAAPAPAASKVPLDAAF